MVLDRINFAIDQVCFNSVDIAVRYALSSLTGARGVEVSKDRAEEVVQATKSLIRTRRIGLEILRKENWREIWNEDRPDPAAWAERRWSFLVNCPPTGVLVRQATARPCKLATVCPFCWARHYVRDLYHRLEYAYYFSHRHEQPPELVGQPRDWDLLEIRTDWLWPTESYPLQDLFEFMRIVRGAYQREFIPNNGSFELYVIEPPPRTPYNEVTNWRLSRRILAMVDPFLQLPPDETGSKLDKHEVQRHKRINRRTLACVVGRTCLYPRSMVFGSPPHIIEILHKRASQARPHPTEAKKQQRVGGYRMSSYHGLLRNKTARQREERLRVSDV